MLYWSACLYWDHLPFWLCCVAGNVLTMPSLRHVNLFAVAVSKAKTNTTITITIIRFWANTELLMYWEEKNETRQKWNLNPGSSLICIACLEWLPSDVHSAGKRPATWLVEGEQLQCRQNGSNLIYPNLMLHDYCYTWKKLGLQDVFWRYSSTYAFLPACYIAETK